MWTHKTPARVRVMGFTAAEAAVLNGSINEASEHGVPCVLFRPDEDLSCDVYLVNGKVPDLLNLLDRGVRGVVPIIYLHQKPRDWSGEVLQWPASTEDFANAMGRVARSELPDWEHTRPMG